MPGAGDMVMISVCGLMANVNSIRERVSLILDAPAALAREKFASATIMRDIFSLTNAMRYHAC
jgi:hypothetical protein